MKAISPFLWFDNNLEEAVDFYASVFPDSKVHSINRLADGSVVTADFELAGRSFKALNGGPEFKFTEAISFFIECEDQDEVDRYWDVLTANGGQPGPCGWCKDRFGLSWQVVPVEFLEMLYTGTADQVQRTMAVMQTMQKLDLGPLREAFAG